MRENLHRIPIGVEKSWQQKRLQNKNFNEKNKGVGMERVIYFWYGHWDNEKPTWRKMRRKKKVNILEDQQIRYRAEKKKKKREKNGKWNTELDRWKGSRNLINKKQYKRTLKYEWGTNWGRKGKKRSFKNKTTLQDCCFWQKCNNLYTLSNLEMDNKQLQQKGEKQNILLHKFRVHDSF